MDAGYYLILSDFDSSIYNNDDLYIYFFNYMDGMREKYLLLLSSLFILSTCLGMIVCVIKDIKNGAKKIVYNVVES